MSHSHRTTIIRSLEEMKEHYIDPDKASRDWKSHLEKHGNTPIIRKCRICSGQEEKNDLKEGKRKPKRPNRQERDENKI